ncbi:MAG: DUF3883 domain-containing protein [Burkholderiaceae bacterium]|nr:DUF3883 domain-containing protein [Burkholderiaceae bacterium]
MTNKDTRRLAVRDLLGKIKFRLTKAREKSDEFKTPEGKTIYFFWTQGGGINIAIDPREPFESLKSIPGVEFSKKSKPYGIRDGSSMTVFPREYQGYRPEDERSKVGRMFVIEQESLTEFLSTLVDLFSRKGPLTNNGEEAHPSGMTSECANSAVMEADEDTTDGDPEAAGSQGYEQDPEMRSAVELYAESVAKKHYVMHGFRVQKFGKPFDLLCEKEGETIHVEVKGSRTRLDTVILTINEVSDAENTDWQSDLFVVDQIVVERVGNEFVAGGGVARVIQKWVPAREMLAPSQFRYRLPDENQWKLLK